MTQSKTHLNSVKYHLADLLEGAVTAWDVIADVTVWEDQTEALVVDSVGFTVQVRYRQRSTGEWQWVLSCRDPQTEQPRSRSYPSVLTMLRGLRAELAPDHLAFDLMITPSAVSL